MFGFNIFCGLWLIVCTHTNIIWCSMVFSLCANSLLWVRVKISVCVCVLNVHDKAVSH